MIHSISVTRPISSQSIKLLYSPSEDFFVLKSDRKLFYLSLLAALLEDKLLS